MTRQARRIARGALVLVILAALIVFARSVHWVATWRAIEHTSLLTLTLAAVVNLASLVLKGIRWWIFLRPIGVPSLGLALRATVAGAAVNNVLIANSGEAARVIFVARAAHVPSEKVLATLALERLFELVSYIVLLALAVTFLVLPPALDRTRPFALVALVVAVWLLAYLVRHPEKAELPVLEGEGLLHRARVYGSNFLRTLTGISTIGRFVSALVVSVASWMLQVATYALTARAAHVDLPIVGTVAAMLAVNLGFAIRATPGNVGVFQMLYAVTAGAFGIDTDQATAAALLIQAQQILPVTLLGLALAPQMIFARRRHTPRVDNVLPGEPIRVSGESAG